MFCLNYMGLWPRIVTRTNGIGLSRLVYNTCKTTFKDLSVDLQVANLMTRFYAMLRINSYTTMVCWLRLFLLWIALVFIDGNENYTTFPTNANCPNETLDVCIADIETQQKCLCSGNVDARIIYYVLFRVSLL